MSTIITSVPSSNVPLAADVADCLSAASLEFVASAALPVRVGSRDVDGVVSAYRDHRNGHEYLLVAIGNPWSSDIPLVRVHSGCLTGDALGSRRCDCGDQLRYSLEQITESDAGALLYAPAHEGRGIGLANKIRAYELQDRGYDTVDANSELGFEVDARSFAASGEILLLAGLTRVGLLTNNPLKVDALRRAGLDVTQVPMPAFENAHNGLYLRTKRDRLGHGPVAPCVEGLL